MTDLASRRRRAPRLAVLALGLLASLSGCEAIGRLNYIPVSQDPALGAEAYPELLASDPTIASGSEHAMVVRMTDRLVAAAKEMDPDVANLFEWEVRLVDRPDIVNAWCLPGGKMAVYTGILPVAETETGLAVVMGHEIAHATLRHGTRKMTRQMNAAALVLLATLVVGDSAEDKAVAAAVTGATASFINLAYGRDAELEADARGLSYMARAGYDPREAVAFWQRMQAASGGGAPPEFLSTHPSNDTRIDQIRELLPDAVAIYEQSRGSR